MTSKFHISVSVELSEDEARHLAVMQKEFRITPAGIVRRALTMYLSKPIPKGVRR